MITAPVSRHIVVADVARSAAWYRDMLGFEGSASGEVTSGPALVQLVAGATAEPASLFFEVDDVAALHAAVRARGGKPGALERVNWIKYRVFDVRDPDGHVLFFGQTFQEPDLPKDPDRQLRKLLPEFPVTHVRTAIAYYEKVLGFKVNYAQDDFAVMYRDDATMCLIPKTPEQQGIGSFYCYIRDADALHAELTARGADVRGTPVSKPWGLRDFEVRDLEGNRMQFGQTFE